MRMKRKVEDKQEVEKKPEVVIPDGPYTAYDSRKNVQLTKNGVPVVGEFSEVEAIADDYGLDAYVCTVEELAYLRRLGTVK